MAVVRCVAIQAALKLTQLLHHLELARVERQLSGCNQRVVAEKNVHVRRSAASRPADCGEHVHARVCKGVPRKLLTTCETGSSQHDHALIGRAPGDHGLLGLRCARSTDRSIAMAVGTLCGH